MNGKTAVVTGAAGGIGFETARVLAGAGAHVVLAGRSEAPLGDAAVRIREAYPRASVSTAKLDLADLASVRDFAARTVAGHPRLDLLVNNAGVMAVPERRLTRDGFELTFGTNHLGHFALTGGLLPALLAAPSGRVVTVSAMIARSGRIAFDNLDLHRGYRPMRAYSASKLANLAFAVELAERASGTSLSSVAVHPGTASTNLQRHGARLTQLVARRLIGVMGQSPEQAARPTLYAATDPAVHHGGFYAPTGRFEGAGEPGEVRYPPAALDAALRTRLWEESERLTGVTFALPAPAAPAARPAARLAPRTTRPR